MDQLSNRTTRVIIDTDVDIDDWMAILYLLQAPNVEVIGITVTGTGAAHLEPGVRNAGRLLQLAGQPQIPVARGAEKPLAYDHQFPEAIRSQMDDMFGIALPNNSHPPQPSAIDFMQAQLEQASEKISILAIGPLTNLAQLLTTHPQLKSKIERIVIMGGAIDVPGNVNAADTSIPNTVAEFNMYCDPVAAQVVIASEVPITLVPLDATQHAPITTSFYLRLLQNHVTSAADFVYQALTADFGFIASGAFDFWDPLAATLLTDPQLGTYRELGLRVHTSDDVRSGQLLLDSKAPKVRACFNVTAAAFEDLFLETLNGLPVARSGISFVLDGERITLDSVSPRELLIHYLHRDDVRKTGTKLVCGQGGCGACTVMLTSYDHEQHRLVNHAVNACLRPLASLDGAMVTTTQGIGSVTNGIDEVQYKLAANNGSQCGYCSPGFVMNMFTLRQNCSTLTQQDIEAHFDGNICRCTGYRPILDGLRQFATDYTPPSPCAPIKIDPAFRPVSIKPFAKLAPPEEFLDYMRHPQPLLCTGDGYTWQRPINLTNLYRLKGSGDLRLVCGNTSIGVFETRAIYAEPTIDPKLLIDVSAVPELHHARVGAKGLEVGGATSLTRLMALLDEALAHQSKSETRGLAALRDQLAVIASHQIRNVASVAGNLHMAVNLGFLSDLLPILATLGATVKVSWATGHCFYPVLAVPKDTELPKDAIYESVHIPYTQDRTYVRAYKVRRREEDCHALVTGGMLVQFDSERRVSACRLVLNGIHADYADQPYGVPFHSLLLSKTCELLLGRQWNASSLDDALACLRSEIDAYKPPLGPRGPYELGQIPFEFRATTAQHLFYKFFVAVAEESGYCPVPPSVSSAGATQPRALSTGRQSYHAYPEEAPVSEPFVKLDAFMQATGEAVYTRDMDRPPNTLEAAYVYGLVAFGQFHYVLPLTSAHGVKGQRVDVEALAAFLRDWYPDFVDYVTFADVPVPAANWIGLGNDEPVFVPSLDQALPEGIQASRNFFPHHLTCVGAPIGLIVARNEAAALDIATAVRTTCIAFHEASSRTFDEAIAEKFYFAQTPPTNPTLTHVPEITRPGSNIDWLDDPTTALTSTDGRRLNVVRGRARNGYQNHFYLETMNTIAVPGENRTITLHTVSQAIADNQYTAAAVLGISAADVHVRLTRIGGGFGGRQTLSHFNSSAAAIAAWKLKRPVRIAMDRNTNFIMCGERHAYAGEYAVAFDENAKLHGFALDLVSDGGSAYDVSLPVMDFSLQSADNAYQIDTYRVRGQVCQTNKLSNTAFRSFGFVQAVNISEQAIEQVAYQLRVPPEEIREKNLYRNGQTEWKSFRITEQTLSALARQRYDARALRALEGLKGQCFMDAATFEQAVLAIDPTGTFSGILNMGNMVALKEYSTTAYDFTPYMEKLSGCNLPLLWDRLKQDCDFNQRRAEIATFNAANRWRKRGISMMPLKYGIAYSDPRGTFDQAGAYVTAYAADGSVLVAHGGIDMGQGLQTKLAQVAAHTLGIDLSLIRMAETDTRVVGDASPTAASTGSDLNGGAVQLACRILRERLTQFCENLEQYSVYFSQFDPAKMDAEMIKQMQTVVMNWRDHWSDVWPLICSLAYSNRIGLSAEARFRSPDFSSQDISHSMGNTFTYYTYAVAASEVEVDVLTGDFSVLRSDILFDVGRSLNPLIDIGQIEGGFVQGIGYLTMEELTFQNAHEAPRKGYPQGALTTTNTWEYKPPGARSIPIDLRIQIADANIGKAQAPGTTRETLAVNRSKGIGEPPLVLANTVFFAIKQAIQTFYRDQGCDEWVEMDAPATVARIQQTCRKAIKELKL